MNEPLITSAQALAAARRTDDEDARAALMSAARTLAAFENGQLRQGLDTLLVMRRPTPFGTGSE